MISKKAIIKNLKNKLINKEKINWKKIFILMTNNLLIMMMMKINMKNKKVYLNNVKLTIIRAKRLITILISPIYLKITMIQKLSPQVEVMELNKFLNQNRVM